MQAVAVHEAAVQEYPAVSVRPAAAADGMVGRIILHVADAFSNGIGSAFFVFKHF